jgi:4-hydroxybenzoate polyprenyltransferase
MTRKGNRLLSRENIGILFGLAISLALAIIADRRGMPHKWHTAIFGTTVPFGVVVLSYPLRWRRMSFWAALTICLAIHTVAIWIFFQYVLSNTQTFGLLLWLPVAFIEAFALLLAVKRIEEKLTGKNESYRLD